MGVLSGVTVIELAETPAGEYCGKILSELGANVIKVERPGSGSPTRRLARLGRPGEAHETSAIFAYLNTDKHSLVLDLDGAPGRERLRALLGEAAVLIDDRGPQASAELGLDPASLARDFPHLVACMVTPFGAAAPEEWNRVQSLNVFHASSWGYHTPSYIDPARPPLKGPGCYNADFEGGLDAAIAVLACLTRVARTGEGDCIDVSQQAALLNRADTMLGRFLNGEDKPRHDRDAFDMPGPVSSYECGDGHVYLFITSAAHWRGLCELMGNPEWIREFEDNWLEFGLTDEKVATFRRHFADWVKDKPKLEICEAAQKLGTPLVPLNNASDLPASPQFQHREYFRPLAHAVLGEAAYPTLPFLLSASPAVPVRAAPLLGEGGEAAASARSHLGKSRVAPHAVAPDTSRGGPLAGIRVVQLTKVWAGPYIGKLLAALGAEVIKVESEFNIDEMRAYGGIDINTAPFFLSLNPQVMSAQFNLKSELGLARLKELIAHSDVVINNLRPGAMERSGLGYEDLRKLRPDIISVSMKMYGNDGPLGYQTGYAPCFAALGGMNFLVGYEGEAPKNVCMRYGDATAGAYAALGAVAAIVHRERTGEGQFVDVSAVEAMASMVGDSLLSFALTGQVPGPDGNFHPDMAPHGLYRCRDDRWISIAVADDGQWRQLCEELGASALAGDAGLASLSGRLARFREIDEAIGAITAVMDAKQLAERLRARGVGAFVSLSSLDIVNQRYLTEQGYYHPVSDHARGSRVVNGPSWKMARAQAAITQGAPLLGEHNEHVFRGILGLDDGAYEEMTASNAMR